MKETVTIGCVIVGQFSGVEPTVLFQLPIYRKVDLYIFEHCQFSVN